MSSYLRTLGQNKMKSSATARGELQEGRNFGLVPYSVKRLLCFVEVNLLQEPSTSLMHAVYI